ncbi:hypothetical protein GCM10012289_59780 [Nonomuraea cavernae]|uniref:Uncharacterized protein n=1 Tax=Nonomuraea cavernae TaxID=2045107 RepID=A0A917Z8X4_9ACTN|nr:hypothetical protein GCM10012289_59780 [Nonomuraea cavernae]
MIRFTQYPPRCESPHVPDSAEYEPLTWMSPREGEPEARVLRWTCDCQPVVYELVTLGGVRYIRRIQTLKERRLIHETDRWIDRVAEGLWNALLFGHVR